MTKLELLERIEKNIDDVMKELAVWTKRRDLEKERLDICQRAIDECNLPIQNYESIKKEVMSNE